MLNVLLVLCHVHKYLNRGCGAGPRIDLSRHRYRLDGSRHSPQTYMYICMHMYSRPADERIYETTTSMISESLRVSVCVCVALHSLCHSAGRSASPGLANWGCFEGWWSIRCWYYRYSLTNIQCICLSSWDYGVMEMPWPVTFFRFIPSHATSPSLNYIQRWPSTMLITRP